MEKQLHKTTVNRRTAMHLAAGLPMLSFFGAAKAEVVEQSRPGGPGLIFGPGEEGWWDSERVSCPKVMRLADDDWMMWYYGRDESFDRQIILPTGRIGLARSKDGIQWTRVKGAQTMGAIFDPHPDPARFDSGHVGISDIHYRDGVYWMWYFGGDQEVRDVLGFKVKGFPLRPGCAVSRDGMTWTRLEGPYDGALLDIGAPGEFDEIMVAWPQVIPWPDGTWRMYYHGMDTRQQYVMGWAESKDGLHWDKRGPLMGPGEVGAFDDLGVATRHMLNINDQWVMFYEGCQNIGSRSGVNRQIGLAVSQDGLEWKRVPGPTSNGSIIQQSAADSNLWDRRLGCPHVVPMPDGSLRLYYIGSNERKGDSELDTINQIGLAVSDGDITEWRRWEAP